MITTIGAMDKVLKERARQDAKWGYPQYNTPFEWVSILTEEVGELAEAVNNAFIGKNPSHDVADVIKEAIQVSAVALSIVEHYSQPKEQS